MKLLRYFEKNVLVVYINNIKAVDSGNMIEICQKKPLNQNV